MDRLERGAICVEEDWARFQTTPPRGVRVLRARSHPRRLPKHWQVQSHTARPRRFLEEALPIPPVLPTTRTRAAACTTRATPRTSTVLAPLAPAGPHGRPARGTGPATARTGAHLRQPSRYSFQLRRTTRATPLPIPFSYLSLRFTYPLVAQLLELPICYTFPIEFSIP